VSRSFLHGGNARGERKRINQGHTKCTVISKIRRLKAESGAGALRAAGLSFVKTSKVPDFGCRDCMHGEAGQQQQADYTGGGHGE
jgi:hypothetical protein